MLRSSGRVGDRFQVEQRAGGQPLDALAQHVARVDQLKPMSD
jgi:hypothetical protein